MQFVLSVSATGLSLYAEQRVDFEQEISDKELTHKGVRLSPTKLFLSLKSVMQRVGSAKRGEGNAVSVSSVSATGLS